MKKLYIILFCIINLILINQINGQVCGGLVSSTVYHVNTYYDGTPHAENTCYCAQGTLFTIRDAINWANTTATTGNLTIKINNSDHASCGQGSQYFNCITLFSDLPPITLGPGKHLTITADSNLFRGFKAWEGLANDVAAGIPPVVTRGLFISTRSGANTTSNAQVVLDQLSFLNWNTTLIDNSAGSVYQHQVLGGHASATCILADNTAAVTVQNCKFIGYSEGIRFGNDIDQMTIHNNQFRPKFDAIQRYYADKFDYGQYYYDAMHQPDYSLVWQAQDPTWISYATTAIFLYNRTNTLPITGAQYKTNIHDNTIYSMSYATELGAGIRIEPFYDMFPVLNTSHYNVRADIEINDNHIKGITHGICQGMVPPIRSSAAAAYPGADGSYELDIHDNTIETRLTGISYEAPYNHFKLRRNTINLDYDQSRWYDHPEALHFGSTGAVCIQSVGGSTCTAYGMMQHNYFGFDITSTVNYDNIFSGNTGYTDVHPGIVIEGNYGPQNTISPTHGINFEDFDFPGFITIHNGKHTKISRCLLKASKSLQGYTLPAILHWGPPPSYDITYNFIMANGGIKAPIITKASIVSPSNNVEVRFKLPSGSVFNNASALGFRVEFFKSNAAGDLLKHLDDHVYTTLPPLNTEVTHIIPAATAAAAGFGFGDYVAATVTSYGTSSAAGTNAIMGTSEISTLFLGDCPKCLGDFSPIPGKKYIVSAWVKFDKPNSGISTYSAYPHLPTPVLQVTHFSDMGPTPPTQLGLPVTFGPEGPVIDGWQKIEGVTTIPANAKGIKIEAMHDMSLVTSVPYITNYGSFLFDDIRFYPYDGTMKSYAYDKDNKRLMAELDENNYATFYEYDEEGKLIRVKKETEKGIMTIKESRNNKPIR